MFNEIAELSLEIASVSTDRLERETSSEFTRVTTEVTLTGPADKSTDDRLEGVGEDVTYETEEHDVLAETGLPDLTGEYTLESFAGTLDDVDLFPAGAPDREVFRNYRRWALESAAVDLALRQNDITLEDALGRSLESVRFVTSTRLGDPPTADRLEQLHAQVPNLEFKLDPTPEWDDAVVDSIQDAVGTDAITILDLKGQYEGTDVDVPADPDLYERVLEAFPEAVIEDPAVTDETRPLLEEPAVQRRLSWDAPIHGIEDIKALPWEPEWLNIKPSRFGSLESLLETLSYCAEREITMYGGGQFELGVGRGQLQLLASLFYPDTPNDVAPGAYNDPDVSDGLPESPLEVPAEQVGFRW
ncbi:hypothetical protein G6M89_03055 [Natronolimnobius sp. AArcel1]|uniref:hypothetical protein n=1 Tax=Natronolimnobius sp. AArcel1 TaxID=1679093 RepID=UPI0013EB972D|nr:hypothetical protein [Natronolimnobius sp. AArcel1]NGM68002.1 hypothetical protein [Natronolimnobius sp. AArcel1]